MSDGLKPYPVYQASGVEWLGEVPAPWAVKRRHQITEPNRPAGFILAVLAQYTPVESDDKRAKKVEGDPAFGTTRGKNKRRRCVESHAHAIRHKTEIMGEHCHEQVLALNKLGGQARALGGPAALSERSSATTPCVTICSSARAHTVPLSRVRARTSTAE
jgi:hypothetical protein